MVNGEASGSTSIKGLHSPPCVSIAAAVPFAESENSGASKGNVSCRTQDILAECCIQDIGDISDYVCSDGSEAQRGAGGCCSCGLSWKGDVLSVYHLGFPSNDCLGVKW